MHMWVSKESVYMQVYVCSKFMNILYTSVYTGVGDSD